MIVLAVVTAGTWRSKVMLRGAARTPEMGRALATYARRLESRQNALHGLEQWFYRKLPGASGMSLQEPPSPGPNDAAPEPQRPPLELTGPDVPASLEPQEARRSAA